MFKSILEALASILPLFNITPTFIALLLEYPEIPFPLLLLSTSSLDIIVALLVILILLVPIIFTYSSSLSLFSKLLLISFAAIPVQLNKNITIVATVMLIPFFL